MPQPAVIGKELKPSGDYRADCTARKFWRLSYRCGRDYITGRDGSGDPVILRHEREKDDAYNRRRKSTKPRNHSGPIIRRYNDFVYRREAERPDNGGPLYSLMLEDADAHKTPLPNLIRQALQQAQIERESYLLPDSTAPSDGRALTKAQAAASGVRPVIKRISADAVIWWRDVDGAMVEAIVLMTGDDGQDFGRWYDAKNYQDIFFRKSDSSTLGQTLVVDSLGEMQAHTYGACPLVRFRPMFDVFCDDTSGESQISPLAESQQAIANYLSLLNEEIFNVTFSQMVATGVSATQVKDVMSGNTRLICLPTPNAKIEFIGADAAQAASIRQAIEDEQRELYRQAGISSGDPLTPSAPESGVAKAFKFNDLAANLSALADSAEEAENQIVARLLAGNSEAYPGDAKYPDDFDMPDYAAELNDLIRLLTVSAIPGVIRDVGTKRFVNRNLALTEEQEAQLQAQMASMNDLATAAASPIPFPNKRPAGQAGT